MNEIPEPGTFRELDEGEWVEEEIDERERPPFPDGAPRGEQTPTPGGRVVSLLRIFGKAVHEPTFFYYPCCNVDISPSVAFPAARVIYVDIEEASVRDLTKSGYEARLQDATMYVPPEEIDTALILNPTISPERPARAVRPGGFIIANNYHGSADAIRNYEDFEFVGLLHGETVEDINFDTEELDLCWEEVDSEEEWENAPLSWGVEYYDAAESIVRRILGPDISALEGYKRLREMVKKQGSQVDDVGILRIEGQKDAIFSLRLPRKKGVVDDLFVFRRKE